jgi:hypothetical protein
MNPKMLPSTAGKNAAGVTWLGFLIPQWFDSLSIPSSGDQARRSQARTR